MGEKGFKKVSRFGRTDGRMGRRVTRARGEGEKEEGSITGGERDCSIISTDRVNVRDVNVLFSF